MSVGMPVYHWNLLYDENNKKFKLYNIELYWIL